jgi:hypothetical protein
MVSPQDRWKLNKTRPQGLELFKVVLEIKDLFVKAEWYDFICSFEGFHTGVCLKFIHTFYGFETQLGDTYIHLTKHFIVIVCSLPVYGKRWFKKGKLNPELCNKFLVTGHENPNWRQGIHVTWIKEECKGPLTIVQRYIIGEG